MSKLKTITIKDYTEDGMDVLEFARNFMERANHPGFKLVIADCIDEIEQLRAVLDHVRGFLENCDNKTCMCGGEIYIKADCTDHNPVSTYDRYVGDILDDVRTALNLIPNDDSNE